MFSGTNHTYRNYLCIYELGSLAYIMSDLLLVLNSSSCIDANEGQNKFYSLERKFNKIESMS